MRRLLAGLLLLVATAAQGTPARVAIITHMAEGGTGLSAAGGLCATARNQRAVISMAQQLGINYTILNARNIKTEWARTGYLPVGPAGSLASCPKCWRQFDAVIDADFTGQYGYTYDGSVATYKTTYHPDSLTRTPRGGCLVPYLFFISNTAMYELGSSATDIISDDCASGNSSQRDTSGVIGPVQSGAWTQYNYLFSSPRSQFLGEPWNPGYVVNPTPPAGGFRGLIGKSVASIDIANPQAPPAWQDSLWFPKTTVPDSVVLWEREWKNLDCCPNAQPQIFATWCGGGSAADSIGNAISVMPSAEGSFPVMLAAYARLDSLLGGRLITKPITIAAVIHGAFSRGLRGGILANSGFTPGPAPADSLTYYATIDSLSKYCIPVTVAEDPDSASSYPNELARWQADCAARFTPQVWNGVRDTANAQGGTTKAGNPVDVWGRWRDRAFYGDGTGIGADSSLWSQLGWQQAKQDSIFGASRRSMFLVPPDDDYSPNNTTAGTVDSIFYVVAKRGYAGIECDGQAFAANAFFKPGYTGFYRTNAKGFPIGWYQQQGTYKSSVDGSRIKLLAHQGYSVYGGAGQSWGPAAITDSSYNAGGNFESGLNWARFWEGAIGPLVYEDNDVWSSGTSWNLLSFFYIWRGTRYRLEDMRGDPGQMPRRGSIMRINAATLSGDPSHPARAGYWMLKSLKFNCDAINALAGRTVINLTYPEYVNP